MDTNKNASVVIAEMKKQVQEVLDEAIYKPHYMPHGVVIAGILQQMYPQSEVAYKDDKILIKQPVDVDMIVMQVNIQMGSDDPVVSDDIEW